MTTEKAGAHEVQERRARYAEPFFFLLDRYRRSEGVRTRCYATRCPTPTEAPHYRHAICRYAARWFCLQLRQNLRRTIWHRAGVQSRKELLVEFSDCGSVGAS